MRHVVKNTSRKSLFQVPYRSVYDRSAVRENVLAKNTFTRSSAKLAIILISIEINHHRTRRRDSFMIEKKHKRKHLESMKTKNYSSVTT